MIKLFIGYFFYKISTKVLESEIKVK